MAVDRTTLRRAIGDRLGDLLVIKATAASADAGSFTDAVTFGDRGDNAASIVNKILYFAGTTTAANIGHEARVTGFTTSTRTLTFAPEAPAIPDEEDEVELWNVTERIGSIDTLHRLINDAIRAVSRDVGTEVWDTAQTFRATTAGATLDIPSTWVEFGGADWYTARGFARPIPSQYLRVLPGQRTVEITGRPAWRANNRSVKLWGYPLAGPLTADTGNGSETEVDSEWLIETVLGYIALAASARASDVRGPSEERRANFWATQAQLYRRSVAAPRRGMGVSLP